jgi:hypothetical protein
MPRKPPAARLGRVFFFAWILIAAALVAACGGGSGGSAPPMPSPLALQPGSVTLGAGTTETFAASGGQLPYGYSIVSGPGAIDSASGVFTAPTAAGSATVKVTDASGESATASVTINGALAVVPASITMTASSAETLQFAGSGGGGGYQYSVVSGTGTVDASGAYTAGTVSGRDTVQVRDAQGTVATATVQLVRLRTNGIVNSIVSNDTSLYLGGSFTAVNPYFTPRLVILDAAAGKPQLQCDLSSGFDAAVRTSVLVNNSLYVGGDFTSYKGQPANALAKLDAKTCALDTNFTQPSGFSGNMGSNASIPPTATTSVQVIAISGSSLFVAGSFTSYRNLPALSLAKLDLQTGVLDQTFTQSSGPDSSLTSLTVSADSLYIGGGFSHYRGATLTPGGPLKLDINSGVMDSAFRPATPAGHSTSTLLYSNGSLYVGAFSSQASQADKPLALSKLSGATGQIDTNFVAPMVAGFSTNKVDCLVASGQSLYVCGEFQTRSGSLAGLGKIDPATGAADNSFQTGLTLGNVFSLAVTGTKLIVGGQFQGNDGLYHNDVKRLDAATGAIDASFGLNPGASGFVLTVTAGTDFVYAGGTMLTYGGNSAWNFAKVDAKTGVADTVFLANSGVGATVNQLLLSGSSMFVGGQFTNYIISSTTPSSAVLLKIDANTGMLDPTFVTGSGFIAYPGVNFVLYAPASVKAMVLSGRSLYVGGLFTQYNGQPAMDLAKLDASSGSLDLTFTQPAAFLLPTTPGPASGLPQVNALASTPAALYVSGNFSQYQGAQEVGVMKLDLNSGVADTAFAPVFASSISGPFSDAMLVSGNNLYVGGSYQANPLAAPGETPTPGLFKLDATTGAVDMAFTAAVPLNPVNGTTAVNALALSGTSLYVGGIFERDLGSGAAGTTNLIKIDATTGALDTTFSQLSGLDGQIDALDLETDALYVGGSFSHYRGDRVGGSLLLDPASGANRDAAAF